MSYLKNVILSVEEGKEKYDNAMKYVLSDVHILARILKAFVPEFSSCCIKDIEDEYIKRETVSVSKVGIPDVSRAISFFSKEDTGFSEANIYYDVLFDAVYPDDAGNEIGLYINIEAQNSYYPEYPLEMRAVYYGARLLCSQLKTINKHTNYGALRKVYSIWLCIGSVPDKDIQRMIGESYDLTKGKKK